MSKEYVFGVIGAGNGGKAMAAYLALLGKKVLLYNRTFSNVEVIAERQGIDLINPGGLDGFGKLEMVTDNIEDLLAGSQVIMVVTPSTAHRDIATAASPYLRDDHIVILHPGRTGGALEFAETLRQNGCASTPIISEAEIFHFCQQIRRAQPRAYFPHKGICTPGRAARKPHERGAGSHSHRLPTVHKWWKCFDDRLKQYGSSLPPRACHA